MKTTVTVKGSWLKACGMGEEDRELEVLSINERASYSPMGTSFNVRHPLDPSGEWVVFECRCVK